jgi:hypothetical protein
MSHNYFQSSRYLTDAIEKASFKKEHFTAILTPILYGCVIWSFTLGIQQKLRISENKVHSVSSSGVDTIMLRDGKSRVCFLQPG